jgi:hypothetical protein
MKKSYTIGRDAQNDIVISDPSDLVSRLHATLKVDDRGHYRIMDQSTNGTYVNGIRVEKFAEVPVTRKDEVSFASVATLDWDEVPQSRRVKAWLIVLFSVIGLAIIGLLAYLFFIREPSDHQNHGGQNNLIEERVDTFKVVIPENTVLKWNTNELTVKVQGNVKWKVSVCDKDGKDVKDVSIDPEMGEGSKTVTIKLPNNMSTKKEAVYVVSVSTEAKVPTQSYSFQVVKGKYSKPTPAPKPAAPTQQTNPAIL